MVGRGTLIGIVAALACAAPAQGATLYLAPGGSDAAACTATAPCRSLNRGYQAAAPGDTVVASAGHYGDQTIQADPAKDGAVAQVTLQSAQPGSAVLTDLLSYAANVRYSGFTVDGSGGGQPDIRGGHDVVVENVHATNFYITGPLHGITIRGGDYGPYATCGGGAHISAADVDERDPSKMPTDILVDGVTFHDYTVPSSCPDAHLDCLHVFTAVRVTVRGSTFERCRHYGILLNSNGAGNRDGHVIENNLFGAAEVAGFALRGGDGEDFDDVLVRNNSGGSITPQTTNVLTNVRWIANAADDIGGCRSGIAYAYNVVARGGCGATDTRAAPGFAGPDDFHLVAGAAAIDHGDPTGFPALDHDGLLRPAGGAPDAGALEYGAVAPPGGGGGAPRNVTVPAPARLALLSGRYRSGRAQLRLRCDAPSGSRCRVALRLSARLPGGRRVHTIGRGNRVLAAGRSVVVRLLPSASARRALARGRTLRVTLSATVRTSDGDAGRRSAHRLRLRRS